MLPPFVPPSVRVPTQPLPLITEFVVDRGERVISSSVATAPWESQMQRPAHEAAPEPALPSIDEFLLRSPLQAQPESRPPEPQTETTSEHAHAAASLEPAAGPPETAETTPQGAAPPSEAPSAEISVAEPVTEPVALVRDYAAETPRTEPEQPSPALEQQGSEPVEQVAIPIAPEEPEGRTDEEAHGAAETVPAQEEVPSNAPVREEPSSQLTSDAWVSEERDSFDWQGAANLAAGADEERRASDEWSSTDWEPRGSGSQEQPEHIVALLAQVARRVRSGELQVHGSKQMTTEAALAAVLAALLAEPD